MLDQKRKNEILSFIPKCEVLSDVGCDHGFIGLEALKRGLAKKVIFSDISEKSLEKAKKLLEKTDFPCEFHVADGLIFDCDVSVIAGMGGREIVKILNEKTASTLVLQPMSESHLVRKFLLKNAFEIEGDKLFLSRGKYYHLIYAVKKDKIILNYSYWQLRYGRQNLESPTSEFLEFLISKEKKLSKIKTSKSANIEKHQELQFIEDYLKKHLKSSES